MGVDKRKENEGQAIYRPPPLRRSATAGNATSNSGCGTSAASPQHTAPREPVKKGPEKEKEPAATTTTASPSVRTKRPDREVYVPRQRRAASLANSENTNSTTGAITQTRKLRLSDKSYCNVYTPPHARSPRSSGDNSIVNNHSDESTNESANNSCNSGVVAVQTLNRKRQLSEDVSDSVVDPSPSVEHLNNATNDLEEHVMDTNQIDVNNDDSFNMTNNIQQLIGDGEVRSADTIMWNTNHNKDEDGDQSELERATQEINRSNRRLIKQSFVSDVLIISDPLKEKVRNSIKPQDIVQDNAGQDILSNNHGDEKRKKEIFNPEEEEWEAMLGEDGQCLEPSMLAELNNAVGRVTIQTPRTAPFRPGPDKDPFSHVLEVYNFPNQFTTNDLLSVFSDFKDFGFEIKWVDDSHALAVFSSAKIAEDVLAYNHPMVKTRPLHEGTQESRHKAKKCAEYLQPYRTRPETCPALARRLVTGALGVRLPTMTQERIQEKKVLSQFKEKKRMETQKREKLREAAWDGSLGSNAEDS